MLTAEQVPYTGPKGSDATKHDDTAPTIEALKRAMVRLGFLDKKLSELDGYWANESMFDNAWSEWSLKKGFQDDHMYGEGKWEELRKLKVPSGAHQGEYALDSYAQDLIQKEAEGGTTTAIEAVRKKIVSFCEQGLRKPGPLELHAEPLRRPDRRPLGRRHDQLGLLRLGAAGGALREAADRLSRRRSGQAELERVREHRPLRGRLAEGLRQLPGR